MARGDLFGGSAKPSGGRANLFSGQDNQASSPVSKVDPTGPSGLKRFAQNLGLAGVSLATGVPAIDLRSQMAQNKQTEAQTARIGQITENERIAAEKQARLQQLTSIAMGDGPGAQAAMNQIFAEDIPRAVKLSKELGIRDQAGLEEAARDASAILALPFEQRRPAILERAARIETSGNNRRANDTLALLEDDEQTQNMKLRAVQASALTQAQRESGGIPAELETFNALSAAAAEVDEQGNPTARARQAQTKLGTRAKAGTISALQRQATDDALGAQVTGQLAEEAGAVQGAKTQAQIDAELRNATAVAKAEAEKAALIEAAVNGERIAFNRVKTAEEARALLPDAEAGADEMTALLLEIRDSEFLPDVLGAIEGRIDARLDQDESALMAKIKQVTGKTFLQAYQSLKGGGPITDREGEAATEAQSRLSTRTVSVPEYQDAIDDLIGITDSRLSRLRRKAKSDGVNTVDGFTVVEVQ